MLFAKFRKLKNKEFYFFGRSLADGSDSVRARTTVGNGEVATASTTTREKIPNEAKKAYSHCETSKRW